MKHPISSLAGMMHYAIECRVDVRKRSRMSFSSRDQIKVISSHTHPFKSLNLQINLQTQPSLVWWCFGFGLKLWHNVNRCPGLASKSLRVYFVCLHCMMGDMCLNSVIPSWLGGSVWDDTPAVFSWSSLEAEDELQHGVCRVYSTIAPQLRVLWNRHLPLTWQVFDPLV